MEIKNRKISELVPAEYNPRRLTAKQFEDLKKSFENLGTLEPAVINMKTGRENIIISGHQRLRVAESLGMTEYPCLEVYFSEDKEREANIRMNKNTGEWDFDILANSFDENDLIEWGFDDLSKLNIDIDRDIKEIEYKDKKYILEIELENETELYKIYERMKKEKYSCRPVIL